MTDESVTLREYLEKLHGEYVDAHTREHIVHADAHAREHALNKEAISKAETSVDKAVSAARETVGADLSALSERLNRSDEEQRRQIDDLKKSITQLGLDVAAVRTTEEGNVKGIQAIQDSQSWIVRIVAGAIILALLGLLIKPGML